MSVNVECFCNLDDNAHMTKKLNKEHSNNDEFRKLADKIRVPDKKIASSTEEAVDLLLSEVKRLERKIQEQSDANFRLETKIFKIEMKMILGR